jgi:hypothetical protein
MSAIYEALTDAQKREVRMYGCTEAEMCEAVEESLTFRFSGPVMYAASIMSDCQEMLTYRDADSMIREDVRQALNRAKWVLFNYAQQSRI